MQAWLQAARDGRLGPAIDAADRETLFEREEAAERTCFLAEGAVEIIQRSPEGFGVVVKILVGPTLFGQIEPLAGEQEYLESVRAAGSARYYGIERDRFVAMMREDGLLSFECLTDMSTAFCVAARYEPAQLFETEVLLANLMLSYARVFGTETDEGVRIGLRRSQADLADAIGGGERSVNRMLAAWKTAGLVKKSRGHYILLDTDALEDKAVDLLGSLVHGA
jgi:CRP/FNR family transcriptional regulator